MTKEVSFIHVADLHLDSPFKGLAHTPEHIFEEIRESTFLALDKLVTVAIQKEVDFVLMVGDLFDNEKQSLKGQIRLRRAFEELGRQGINVYLSYGNHDYINGNILPVTYPENVYIFPDENVSHFTFMKDNLSLANIYGFSYENRAVLEEKAKEYRVTDPEIPFHIATLHGSIRSNTEHDVYAPFQLSDLEREPFHYWALGHIHKREVMKENPPIVYPGNIQGRNRKEIGPKGCYHVVLRENHTSMLFVPLHSFMISRLRVDVSECDNLHQVEVIIQEALEEQENEKQLIDLYLTSNHSILKEWEQEKLVADLIELINETKTFEPIWKYIFRVTVEVNGKSIDAELKKGNHFAGELIRQLDNATIQEFTQELYHHKQARKYLKQLTPEDEERIKRKAKEMILTDLLKGGIQ
ncbi:metallophosphoesterase family protein [Oceanobacillus senegalensis]|uniref:metallophosphoesterase family protein n=1 Tax=Oceanobacillus senegalensis TaxID=1936063 RepID=UPI000A30D8B7|nr:DNA repair exonuclease [Oceanobacillus senegalensis]